MPFYENYIKLCNSIGKSPSAVAIELKLGKPSVTRWKNGTVPRDATVQKIADYFGITVDELKNGIKKEPSTNGEELDKNDAVWEARNKIMQALPTLNAQQLGKVVNFIENIDNPAASYKDLMQVAALMDDERFKAVLAMIKAFQ